MRESLRAIDTDRQCFIDGRSSARLRLDMVKSAVPKPPAHSLEDKQALGAALASARKAAGLTLDTAAAALREQGFPIGKAAIGHWETGTNVPDALWVRRLSRLYKTTMDAVTGAPETAVVWPFSKELHEEVLNLAPEDMRFMEAAMWSQLRKVAPSDLHYYADGRKVSHPPKAPELMDLRTTSQVRQRKTS